MSSKKIYIDGLALVEGHFSGIGQYILGIVRGFDELIDTSKLNNGPYPKVSVIIPYDSVERFQSFNFKHIGYKRVPFSFRVMSGLWHRGKMPPLDLFCGRGTYIFTRFVGMSLIMSKSCVIIYDLSYELHKQYSNDKNTRFLTKYVPRTLKKSEKIITISESVKNEIEDFYNIPSEKIIVAYPAADQGQFYKRSSQEIKEVKKKYGIQGDYILALSNLEPRKNLDSLVDVYCSLPTTITNEVGLLLVGVNGWKVESLFNKIVSRVDEGFNIMRPSKYVNDMDKPAIISGAKILVYPSHYEGFGMPPLEALSCGVPVITSDNSSLPEAVGKAGTMVSSEDPRALEKAITEHLTSWERFEKAARTEGPSQAAKFSWAKSAKTILDEVGEI